MRNEETSMLDGSTTLESITLLELNALVRRTLEREMPAACWIQAELSDVRLHGAGHCYVEFVQKDGRSNQLVAKARGVIWSNVYRLLRPYFEESTGRSLQAGIKVQVLVEVSFHELYGYTLVVQDIDPSYTLGDLARRRQEILRQLEEEGVLTLNKELPLPVLPQRVAVISSPTAAGYDDFCHQLAHNPYGFHFHVELFPAWMQGEKVEQSVLSALDAVVARMEEFDVVVIIRGGGATSDLVGFDTYLLSSACAQFPLPILTGIGHERDDTVVDMVAHTRVKTPTAAAEFLIARMEEAAGVLEMWKQRLYEAVERRRTYEHRRLEQLCSRIPATVYRQMSSSRTRLLTLENRLWQGAGRYITAQRHRLQLLQQRVNDASPARLLALGYTLTLKDGKAVKDALQLRPGDRVQTCFRRGTAWMSVEQTNPEQEPDNK